MNATTAPYFSFTLRNVADPARTIVIDTEILATRNGDVARLFLAGYRNGHLLQSTMIGRTPRETIIKIVRQAERRIATLVDGGEWIKI